MAGKPKPGLDYAGWSVNLFDGDTKIDKLLDTHGWKGFGVYFYLCQMAYKFDGYFYRWCFDDSATTARRMGAGITSGTVEETVRTCLLIGLFDNGVFDRWGILTSRGIQKRFYAALQGRRVKSVIKEYWLLSDAESKGLVKCAANENFSPTNAHLQPTNAHLQPADGPKRKGKESIVYKEEDDIGNQDIAVVFSAYFEKVSERITERIKDDLLFFIREMGPECCIRAMDEAIEANAVSWRYIKATLQNKLEAGVRSIEAWDEQERRRAEQKKSGDDRDDYWTSFGRGPAV